MGEYYTPAWLARALIQELEDDPLNQRVLDPACGSGTFVAEAVAHFIEASRAIDLQPAEVLNGLREAVTGIDVHPVAVHLARAAWTLAARPAINATTEAGYDASMSIPVYLGDALQLRFRTGDMFAESQITIQTMDEQNTELVFPISLVQRAETFDALMGDISDSIERGYDATLALDDNRIDDPAEREILGNAISAMRRLHDRGRNHIWAYYTRNMVRPVVLSRSKVDVLIGNPPWINFNQTADILRDELRSLSRNRYGIWAGGRYATHQDVAGLFFSRSVDLYLKDGGVIGFVLPHSALHAGQYAKWRGGSWQAGKSGPTIQVDCTLKRAWDLENLKPNSFFPVPASVIFARKLSQDVPGKPLAGGVGRWRGIAGAEDMRRESVSITDTGTAGQSPYGGYSRQGATIVPRCLFFVNETENTAIVQAAPSVTVNPRRGRPGQDAMERPGFDRHHRPDGREPPSVQSASGRDHRPVRHPGTSECAAAAEAGRRRYSHRRQRPRGIRLGGLERWMRERWQTTSRLWEENKAPANSLNLLEGLNYVRN